MCNFGEMVIKTIDKRKKIKDNKNMVGRILSSTSNKIEDKQTATIFSNLLHLPDKTFWDIIRKACFNNNLPENIGTIEDYEFWPHWKPAPEDTVHSNYVEPDIFIRFTQFDIIFEAKKLDRNQQETNQWINEYTAYLHRFGNTKRVILIAIGGLFSGNLSAEKYNNLLIQKCRWRSILDVLYSQLNIQKMEGHKRIIKDCIEYLEYFNFMRISWIHEIQDHGYKINLSINKELEWVELLQEEKQWFIYEIKNNNFHINHSSINSIYDWSVYGQS
jgi:hypothetical protein